jgi:tyrosyl-tRNA synthetase
MSPFKFYQYLLTSVADAEVIKFLRMLTFVPLEDITELERSMQQPGYQPNTAQRLLASEVTRFVHGQQGLDQALSATKVGISLFPSISAE